MLAVGLLLMRQQVFSVLMQDLILIIRHCDLFNLWRVLLINMVFTWIKPLQFLVPIISLAVLKTIY